MHLCLDRAFILCYGAPNSASRCSVPVLLSRDLHCIHRKIMVEVLFLRFTQVVVAGKH